MANCKWIYIFLAYAQFITDLSSLAYISVIFRDGFIHQFMQEVLHWAFLVAQKLKHLPAMWGTWVWSLGQEDPLEKEMATHSSILAWRIPWRKEPGRLQSMGWQRVFTFSGKESAYPFKRPGMDPWVGKIPWRRKWQPTPVFLPAESHE